MRSHHDLQSESFGRRGGKYVAYAFAMLGAIGLLLGSAALASSSHNSAVDAETAFGTVHGQPLANGLVVFRGIPYAQKPLGSLRWKPPLPPVKWSGVYDASTFKPACMQKLDAVAEIGPVAAGIGNVSEDCLYLNVWRSQKSHAPVLVWIYGGAFKYGAGSVPIYDAAKLAARGVVVVTFDYRLGVFGFLSHPLLSGESAGHSGNYGLLDQLAALRWVKQNISRFGGDPERVTVFGQSAGASSIGYLMLSPMARGLFQRAILQSPAVMRPLLTQQQAEDDGLVVGNDLAAMRKMSAQALLTYNEKFAVKANRTAVGARLLGPVVDGWVIPRDESSTFAGNSNHQAISATLPVMIGGNADEGKLFVKNWTIHDLTGYRKYLAANFGSQAVGAFDAWPVQRDDQVPQAVSDLNGDLHFQYGVRELSRLLAASGHPVYRYHFTRRVAGSGPLPTHEDEINYVFGHVTANGVASPGYDAVDQDISDEIMKLWINFAVDGNPNGRGPEVWTQFVPHFDNYLEIGSGFSEGRELHRKQLDFIRDFYRNHFPQ